MQEYKDPLIHLDLGWLQKLPLNKTNCNINYFNQFSVEKDVANFIQIAFQIIFIDFTVFFIYAY